MKKILNWTFGGFFRALGRVLCFLAIGTIIALIIANNDIKLPDILSLGIMKVNADTLTYDYSSFAVREGTTWTSQGPFGTGVHNLTVNAVSIRLGYTDAFKANQTYRIIYDVGYADITVALEDILVLTPSSYTCAGSTQWSSWTNNEGYIQSCNLIGATRVNNTNKVRYVFEITPLQNIKGIQTIIRFDNDRYTLSTINVYNTTNITFPEDVGGAINEQTTIIQNEFNDLSQTINENNQNLIDAITEQNQVCKDITIKRNTSGNTNGALASNCSVTSSTSAYITDYLDLTVYSSVSTFRSGASYCFYDSNKIAIGTKTGTGSSSTTLTIPTNARYIRFQVPNQSYEYGNVHSCKNSGQATTDLINDSDSSEATNEASDFFNNFTTNTHGLTSIVTAPLNAISSLTSSSCTPLHLPIPYLDNKYIDLPCMRSIYDQNFGSFMTLYDTITFGIVSYWIIVRIFALVKDFKNPDHDEIEVVDL